MSDWVGVPAVTLSPGDPNVEWLIFIGNRVFDEGAVRVALSVTDGTKVEEFTFGGCGAVTFPDGTTGDHLSGFSVMSIFNYRKMKTIIILEIKLICTQNTMETKYHLLHFDNIQQNDPSDPFPDATSKVCPLHFPPSPYLPKAFSQITSHPVTPSTAVHNFKH